MNEFESYDDFCKFVNKISIQKRYVSGFRHKKYPEIVFGEKDGGGGNIFCHIVHLPKNIKWDWNIHENAHTTWFNTGGGLTGCGSGALTICCWKDEVHDTILNLPSHIKYIRILRCGMNFAGHANKTPMSYFFEDIARWERNENDYWVKGHIIAKPDKPANLHDQDIILNREWWNKLGSPKIFNLRFTDYERADTNFHDDYTPHWLKPKDYPIIRNFSEEERKIKAFSYNRYPNEPVTKKTGIPQRYTSFNDVRNSNKYYPVNTETMSTFMGEMKEHKQKLGGFDVIVSPTAGLVTEFLAKELDIKHIVFYDITDIHIELKKQVVELITSADEFEWWVKSWKSKTPIDPSAIEHIGTRPKIVKDGLGIDVAGPKNIIKHPNEQSEQLYGAEGELTIRNGTLEQQLENLEWARNNCRIDYVKFDLLEDHFSEFSKYTDGKKVLWNASNIFSFVKTHIVYRLPQIMTRYNLLQNFLQDSTKGYIFKGAYPNKIPVLMGKDGYIKNPKGETIKVK